MSQYYVVCSTECQMHVYLTLSSRRSIFLCFECEGEKVREISPETRIQSDWTQLLLMLVT